MNLRFIQRAAGYSAGALLAAVCASTALGCACGCGIYEVGTSSMIPSGVGADLYMDFAFQDQSTNWAGTSKASADDNPDKDIRTRFLTFGYQQMFTNSWGVRVELPYVQRHFVTTGGPSGSDVVGVDFSGLGDMRIEAIRAFGDAEAPRGLIVGVKLPTGSYTTEDAYDDVDRDTEIGSGSTDLLIGGFQRVSLGGEWEGFGQALLDQTVFSRDHYRPGAEFDASIGAYYTGWKIGRATLVPIAQVKYSARGRDTGYNAADPVASGFSRVFAAPGFEIDAHPFKVYADVELPLYVRVTGNQLVARTLYRVSVSRMF